MSSDKPKGNFKKTWYAKRILTYSNFDILSLKFYCVKYRSIVSDYDTQFHSAYKSGIYLKGLSVVNVNIFLRIHANLH